MDQELREAFATLSAQVAGVGSDAREASARAREAAFAVGRLTARVEHIEQAVFGGKPPSVPPPAPLAHRVTEGEGDVADLAGRLLAVQSELAAVKSQNQEQLEVLAKIAKAVSGVTSNPLVRKVAAVALTVLLLWLTAMQAKLQLMPHAPDAGGVNHMGLL